MNAMTRRRSAPMQRRSSRWCCALALLRPASAAPGSWTQTADLPSPATATTACVVDGILYLVGGCYPYSAALATVWAYDPATNGWHAKRICPRRAALRVRPPWMG